MIVVVAPHGDAVRKALPDCEFAVQKQQRGTGDALLAAAPLLPKKGARVLVLYGDTPLIEADLLRRLQRAYRQGPLSLVTLPLAGLSGYGRVVRENSRVVRIVEQKDATTAEKKIQEGNAGIYLFDAKFLAQALRTLRPSRKTGEIYLTDLVARAAKVGQVATVQDDQWVSMGINDQAELAESQRRLQKRILVRHQVAGVRFENTETTQVEADVAIGSDSEVGSGVELRGCTSVGRACRIAAGCVVTSSRIEDGAELLPYCVITESRVGPLARVGPFAHLRPGSELGPKVHVGNFVETKKTRISEGSKANHLTYLGDADIGAHVNVGAGTITCNYDGFAKYKTILEDGVFVGSDTQFVAPVTVGKDAYIGAGSTITQDVPAGALALTRTPQKTILGYTEQRRARHASQQARQKVGMGR